jgi:hypothetical protein
MVDADDFDVWRAHFGEMASSGAVLGEAPVPEPTSMLLAMLGLAGMFVRVRLRSVIPPQELSKVPS